MRYMLPLLLLVITLGVRAAEPSCTTLPNGLRLIAHPVGATQLVSVELLVNCSALDEPYQYQGIRQVLLRSMLQGSATLDGNAIRHALDDAGGILEGRVRQDVIEFSVTLPAKSLKLALDVLTEVVCHPQLADAGVKDAIEQARLAAGQMPTDTVNITAWYSEALLYNAHPYFAGGLGIPEAIGRITPDLVRLAYQYFIRPDKTVVAIVGRNLSPDVLGNYEKAIGGWERGQPHNPRMPIDPPVLKSSQLLMREAPVQNSCVMMTFPVCGCTHADYLGLRVIESILSGGTGSRLFRNVREQQHLAYEVSTRLPNLVNDSYFSLYALTNNRNIDATKAALIAELSRLQTDTLATNELSRAKAYLKGRLLLDHQSCAQSAFNLAWNEVTGLGVGYESTLTAKIDTLTAADIRRIANNYFTHYYLVVVIPQTVAPLPEKTTGLCPCSSRVQHS